MSDYGTDFDCVSDLAFDLRVASTTELTLLQTLARLLQGRLWYEPTRGVDVLGALGASGADLPVLRQRIALELEQDERVRSVTVNDLSQDDESLTVDVRVSPRGGQAFDLVLTIDRLSGAITASSSNVAVFGERRVV